MIKKFNEFINEDFTDLYKRWKKKEVRKEDKDNTQYIDLGLPSGTLWGDRNLGADSPEDYGDYYAWGEIDTKEKYSEDTYKWGKDYIKYNAKDGKKVLDLKDDVVYKVTHGKSHIPTVEQFKELMEYTHRLQSSKGIVFKSKKNNNSIFFPYCGYMNSSNLMVDGLAGYYWTSNVSKYYENAYVIHPNHGNIDYLRRCVGLSLRGVKDKE